MAVVTGKRNLSPSAITFVNALVFLHVAMVTVSEGGQRLFDCDEDGVLDIIVGTGSVASMTVITDQRMHSFQTLEKSCNEQGKCKDI